MLEILKIKVMEKCIIMKYVTRILRYKNKHNALYFVLLWFCPNLNEIVHLTLNCEI